jgi:hypothetical protein
MVIGLSRSRRGLKYYEGVEERSEKESDNGKKAEKDAERKGEKDEKEGTYIYVC